LGTQKIKWVVALCAALVLTTTAKAQQSFATVDFQECAKKSKLKTELDQQFESVRNGLLGVFQKLKDGNSIFLNKAELTELAGILEKGDKSTDAEKKRLVVLQEQADKSSGTLKRLQETPTLTVPQKTDLERLAQLQQDGVQLLQSIGDEYTKRIEEQGRGLEDRLDKAVRAAVKKIAEEKKIALVFPSNVVVYSASDITEDVVKELQKK
jgi:Skp family chaperone for outer membrane proteins